MLGLSTAGRAPQEPASWARACGRRGLAGGLQLGQLGVAAVVAGVVDDAAGGGEVGAGGGRVGLGEGEAGVAKVGVGFVEAEAAAGGEGEGFVSLSRRSTSATRRSIFS